jgi:Do/DeqQ family serine protease
MDQQSFAYRGEATAERPARSYWRLPVLLLILVAVASLAFLPFWLENISYHKMRGEIAAIEEAFPDQKAGALAKIFTPLAKRASPSVVHIETERRYMLRDDLAVLFGPEIRRQQGQASGVIVDEAGYIVTNFHVVANANVVSVRTSDGRDFEGEVIGSDPVNDLAVVRIKADGKLIPMEWGDSDALDVGEMVWAIGNPFGLDNTLTYGIVSAKDRRGLNPASRYQEFLQTDAAVNPGNSGGPLVNMAGQIVGINTAIVGPTYSGVSFSIPSNAARRIYQQIREHGEVVNGYLGVDLLPRLTEEIGDQLGLESLEGALVRSVLPGSPAEKAGLDAGDFVIEYNGNRIEDAQELIYEVARTAPGEKATLKIIRDGKERTLQVTIGRKPANGRK